MGCRRRKLSLFFYKFLSAVGVLEQDCLYIFCNFGAMSLVAKTPCKASLILGTFSNDKGKGNVKKPVGLLSKTTTLHVHHAFLYISLLSPQDFTA